MEQAESRRESVEEPPPDPNRADEVESLDRCPLCDSDRLQTWRWGRDRQHRASRRRYRYARCRDCDLVFLAERPTETAIGAFYPDDYGPYHAVVDSGPRPRRSRGSRWILALLRRVLAAAGHRWTDPSAQRLDDFYQVPAAGARLLDYGCGSTQFLDPAKERGWQTIGMDVSPQVVKRVAAAGHRSLPASSEAWQGLEDGAIDLIRMHHVLEHLYRPREVLQAAVRKLRPGGRLHLGLPEPKGPASRLFGSRWWGLECPRHLFLMHPRRVTELLRELGLEQIEVVREASAKDFARSVAYLLHDLRLVSHRGVLVAPGGPLASALVLPLGLLARVGLSDRFHVFARKPGDPGPGIGNAKA